MLSKHGDTVAVRVMEYVGDLLGGAIAGFATVADPEAIVIGGGVSKAGQPLIDCIQKHYMRICIPDPARRPLLSLRRLEMMPEFMVRQRWFSEKYIFKYSEAF